MIASKRTGIGVLGVVLAAAAAAGLLTRCSSKAAIPANVLLISIDMLRPDHLSCYGYEKNTSPNIDRLAAEGVLFENHISSSSWTLPAHAAMFTSLPDTLHGCTDTDKRLCDKAVTLAQRFLGLGYQTVGFFSGPYLHPAFGLGRGFQTYVDCCSNKDELDNAPPSKWAMDEDAMKKSHQDITSPRVYAAIQGWLAKREQKPFFMFVHLWDTHFDFVPPPPYDKQFDPDYKGTITGENFFFNPAVNAGMDKRDLEHILALYDGEIAWTDSFIGKIREDLERAGMLENTVIAITSDHGTEFFEHGDKGHRKTLYDEVLRIPLVLRYPAKLPRRMRISEQTRMIDLGPTLIALAGYKPTPDMMGESLRPYVEGQPDAHHRRAVSDLQSVGRNMRSVRTIPWKFIDDMGRDTFYYFDLKEDPHELKRLRDPDSEQCKKLQAGYLEEAAAMEAFIAQHDDNCVGTASASSPPPEVIRQLEKTGYLGKDADAVEPHSESESKPPVGKPPEKAPAQPSDDKPH
jgi:arylsulfatase A-like enzyme